MSARCLVVEREDGWHVTVGDRSDPLGSESSPEEIAARAQSLREASKLEHVRCLLCPDSSSCWFYSWRPPDDVDLRDRAALIYELEAHLPIDAEAMVADFMIDHGDRSVASVAIDAQRWRPIVEALEAAGFSVRWIVPAAILAARAVHAGVVDAEVTELILVDGSQCDLITLNSAGVLDWQRRSMEPDAIRRQQILRQASVDHVIAVDSDVAQRERLKQAFPNVRFAPESAEALRLRGADVWFHDRAGHWFDLRRDGLATADPLRAVQSQLRRFAVALAICLLAVAIGSWYRARRIERAIESVHAEQTELFRKSFPDVEVPRGLLRRVRSEHQRAMRSRGGPTAVEAPRSATRVLRRALESLPADVRYRIDRIRVTDGALDLDVQVRSPVDAGALATSLSQAGFQVDPPVTTQKDAKTFESVVSARWIGPSGTGGSPIRTRSSVAGVTP